MRYKKEIAGTTGQAAKKFEKWSWAAHLKFLDVTLTERARTSNVTTRTERLPVTLPETLPPDTANTSMTSTSVTNEPTSEQEVFTAPNISQPSHESSSVRSRAKKQKKDPSDMDKVIDYLQNKKKTNNDAADNLFTSYAQTFKKLSLKNQVFVKLELAKLFAEIELKDAEEKVQLSYSPIYSVISSNSDTQHSNITISEMDPYNNTAVDLSNIDTTRSAQSQPNYNVIATQQPQTEQNNNIINYGASTSLDYYNNFKDNV